MQGIPIIVTRLGSDGTINIATTLMNLNSQSILGTVDDLNNEQSGTFNDRRVKMKKNTNSNHTQSRQHQQPRKNKKDKLNHQRTEEQKNIKKFSTLDNTNYRIRKYSQKLMNSNYCKQTKKSVKIRGKTEDTEDYLIQDNHNQNQACDQSRNVKIRRIQSSGTTRRLPRDFFSRDNLKSNKKEKKQQNDTENIQNKRFSQQSSKQMKPRKWTTIEPRILNQTKFSNIDNQSGFIKNQYENKQEEQGQTPKFPQKKESGMKKVIFSTASKIGINSQGELNKIPLAKIGNLQKLYNLSSNKKKHSNTKTSKDDKTAQNVQKRFKNTQDNNETNNNIKQQLQNLINSNRCINKALQTFGQNATFGQNQWPSHIQLQNEEIWGKSIQKQNRPTAQFVIQQSSAKKTVSAFRQAYDNRVCGIKQKTKYFAKKQI